MIFLSQQPQICIDRDVLLSKTKNAYAQGEREVLHGSHSKVSLADCCQHAFCSLHPADTPGKFARSFSRSICANHSHDSSSPAQCGTCATPTQQRSVHQCESASNGSRTR